MHEREAGVSLSMARFIARRMRADEKKNGGNGEDSSNDEKIPEIQISVEIVGVRIQQRLDKQACLPVNVIIVSYFLPIVSTRDSTSNIHRASRLGRILRRHAVAFEGTHTVVCSVKNPHARARARAVQNFPSPRNSSRFNKVYTKTRRARPSRRADASWELRPATLSRDYNARIMKFARAAVRRRIKIELKSVARMNEARVKTRPETSGDISPGPGLTPRLPAYPLPLPRRCRSTGRRARCAPRHRARGPKVH